VNFDWGECPLFLEYAIGICIALGLSIYLLYALLFPENF
jgi:K+-transporting ATPase KdpF subunit